MGDLHDRVAGIDPEATTPRTPAPAPTPAAPALPTHLRPVHAAAVEESRRLATRLTALAPSFHDPESEEHDEDAAEAELLSVALALRCTRTVAERILRDAHIAVTQLPRTLVRLDGGEIGRAHV